MASSSSGAPVDQAVSQELAGAFPAYQSSLNLQGLDGQPLTGDRYRDYLLATYLQPAATTYLAGLSDEERRACEQLLRTYGQVEYARYMAARPQTLYGIADSPVGLAAWLLDHNDADDQPAAAVAAALQRTSSTTGELTRDEILDNITLYWLTGTGVSASRLYWEYRGGFFDAKGVGIPVAVSVFPGEQYEAPRSWTERAYPQLVHYNRLERGGHFAAWEQPQLFAAELRAGFRSLRGPGIPGPRR